VGIVAIIGGWIVSEAGRQPWVVYGVLRTGAAVSHLSAPSVIASFVGFVSLYVVMLAVWIAYLVRQVKRGPDPIESSGPPAKAPTQPAAEEVPTGLPTPVLV
jgi:cytochrome d ubiquinol oxidase subunit I